MLVIVQFFNVIFPLLRENVKKNEKRARAATVARDRGGWVRADPRVEPRQKGMCGIFCTNADCS